MKTLGILIVNYNQLKLTIDCVEDLRKQINQNFELFVIDQNSDEKGTKESLDKLNTGNIKIIYNNKNEDLNRVWNYFYSNCDSDYLCFLNNDIRLTNNFTDDIINIFNLENNVGAVVHVTNNLKYTKPNFKLNYEILSPPLYQGWDFTLRREAFTEIPKTLKIFGGDDFLFANLKNKKYEIALTYSSPIIHYKERTRKTRKDIHEIQQSDGINYWKEIKKRNLTHTNSTINTNKCNKYPPNNITLTQNKNCVFTTIIGDYDNLPNINKRNDNWDYFCFTNNINLKSNEWKIIYYDLPNFNNITDIKLSRYFKTNFDKYLLSYNNLLYIDARMDIIKNIDGYLKHLGDNDINFMIHPNAKTIKEEMDRVLIGKLENKVNISKLKEKYLNEGYGYNNGLFAGGVILFKNNERTIKFFNDWWEMILNHSHRDQLSLNYVLWKNKNIKYGTIPFYKIINNFFMQRKRKSKRELF